jgi:hypothetical protein
MLIEKNFRISLARVELIEIFSKHNAFGIRPRAGADTGSSIRRLVAVIRIVFDAQVGVPGLIPEPDGARQILANTIGAAQSAEIRRFVPGAADEKSCRRIRLGALRAEALVPIATEKHNPRQNHDPRDASHPEVLPRYFRHKPSQSHKRSGNGNPA